MAKQPKTKSSRRNRAAEEAAASETTRQPRAKSAQLRAKEAWGRRETKPLVCRNDKQKTYLNAINTAQIVIGEGPAGTGKTYVCMKRAAQLLDDGKIKRIVVVRPIIEAGGGLGFLKGDVKEKTAPYQVPFIEVLEEHYGVSHVTNMMEAEHPTVIFIAPEFIRGRTFKDAFVVLDEAQNMTPDQMKTFLTRLGEDTRCVINGDVEQVDIKGKSGLVDAIEILQDLENVDHVVFVEEEIVRSGICKAIAMRYRRRKLLESQELEKSAKVCKCAKR